MSDWILVACLKKLMAEFTLIAPNRDHASDGSIGDTAHQHEVSDHNPDETGSVPIHDADHTNEVHAIDVDSDLREPGLSMEDVVQHLLARCRSGKETRLRYIIYNRRIWEADNGWKERPYTGSSAHTEHAHFSASYDTAKEASTASWHLEDLMELSDTDIDKIAAAVEQRIAAHTEQDPATGKNDYRIFGAIRTMNEKFVKLQDELDEVKALVQPAAGGSATL